MPMRCPGSTVNDTCFSTSTPGVYANDTSSTTIRPAPVAAGRARPSAFGLGPVSQRPSPSVTSPLGPGDGVRLAALGVSRRPTARPKADPAPSVSEGSVMLTGVSSSPNRRSRRGHGRLQEVELLGHVRDGPEEALGVLDERDERADGQRAAEHPAAAEPQDQRGRQRADQLDRRIEHRVVVDRPQVGVAVLAVDVVELGERSPPRAGTAAPSTCR